MQFPESAPQVMQASVHFETSEQRREFDLAIRDLTKTPPATPLIFELVVENELSQWEFAHGSVDFEGQMYELLLMQDEPVSDDGWTHKFTKFIRFTNLLDDHWSSGNLVRVWRWSTLDGQTDERLNMAIPEGRDLLHAVYPLSRR